MAYNPFISGYHAQPLSQADPSIHPEEGSERMFSWMPTLPVFATELLPRAAEPLVFEGYVPDAFHSTDLLEDNPPDPEPEPPRPLPVLHHRASDSSNSSVHDSRSTSQETDRDAGHDNGVDDEEVGTPDGSATGEKGVYAGTRSKKGARPRKSYAKQKKKRDLRPGGWSRRGGWSKGVKTGPRPTLPPSNEFSELYKDATDAYLGHDSAKALELITQAIAINPEQWDAHSFLAEIHRSLGNNHLAIDALFVGAHARPNDPDVWKQVGTYCMEDKSVTRPSSLEKAIKAFSELISRDSDVAEARFQRAVAWHEQGRTIRCINELNKLLDDMPHHSDILELYAKACIDMKDIPKAINLYKEAIQHYLEVGLDGEDTFEWKDTGVYVDLVSRNGKATESIPVAIKALRKLSRWLLRRETQTYWEDWADDREYDGEDEPRRITVPEYSPGRFLPEAYGRGLPLELRTQLGILRLRNGDRDEALTHFSWLEPEEEGEGAYVYEFPDLFLSVATSLADAKDHAEALRYYEAIEMAGCFDTHSFWIGIGHSSYVCSKKEQALECFHKALACDTSSIEAKTWIAKCLLEQNKKLEALQYAKEAVETAEEKIPKTDKRVYEKRGNRLLREEATRILKEAHKLIGPKPPKRTYKKRKRPESDAQVEPAGGDAVEQNDNSQPDTPSHQNSIAVPTEPAVDDIPAPKRQKRPPRSLKVVLLPDDEVERYERILQHYTTLLNNTDAMRAGDSIARGIWIDCAKSLIDDFRSNKVFFPRDRHSSTKTVDAEWIRAAHRSSPKTNHSSPSEHDGSPAHPPATYRDISFSAWLDVFLEYALLLTQDLAPTTTPHARRTCYATLNTATSCILFFSSPTLIFQIHICYLICALHFKDEKTLFNTVLRWFIREHAFCTDAYRLFGAMNFYFPYHLFADKGGKEGMLNRAIWRNGPTQKFLRRHVYAVDRALPDDYADENGLKVPGFMRKERDENFTAYAVDMTGKKVVLRPEEMDVVLLVLYGQILYATGSFVSALNYFYRARAIDSGNPLVLLSISLSYMHQMLKRQNENRHVMVLQGWAMFGEYEDARIGWARKKEEEGQKGVVEECKREVIFNKARCWDMLGMGDLARREYEKLLLEKKVIDEGRMEVHGDHGDWMEFDGGEKETVEKNEEWTMEAAYAMSNMYLMGGDAEAARGIAEKYLVVE